MTIDHKVRDKKLQYDINSEEKKILALSSSKIDRYEHLIGEEILTFDQRRVVEKTKFTYSLSGKALENKQKQLKIKEKKQIKAIEEHGKQLVESNTSVKNDYERENDYDSKT